MPGVDALLHFPDPNCAVSIRRFSYGWSFQGTVRHSGVYHVGGVPGDFNYLADKTKSKIEVLSILFDHYFIADDN